MQFKGSMSGAAAPLQPVAEPLDFTRGSLR